MIAWLNNKVLSASQWLLLSMAGAIGILVVALRAQRTALHKAQVDLLRTSVELDTAQDDEKVARAQAAFLKALKEYHNADE